ncbi:MAG: hypothetical protein HYU28_10020 [Actinobacteria bacterium]|nr:hypothetical protein [Actinomycetota bacterium]
MTPDPGDLGSWRPLLAITALFVGIVVTLAITGRRSREPNPLLWISRGLERATGIPGWAAAMIGVATWGLLCAGIGFYNDVTWHVAVGRDEELFTAPHAMIAIGLVTFVIAGAVGILFATLERWDSPAMSSKRIGGLRIPRSALTMLVVGAAAVSGFGLDELWHEQFGIDVTMWSPTHLLMIVGASITPVVSWLALAEAGVRPSRDWRTRAVHLLVAFMLLDGLSSVQGEFDFGVPQFQQLYAPVLVSLAAGLAFAAVRLAHGRGWGLLMAGFFVVTRVNLGGAPSGIDLNVRASAIYVGSALAVEAAAWLAGTGRRLRYALTAGVGVGTLGLAVEFLWNQGAHQPWTAALLPDAVIWGTLAATGAAVVGAALGDVANLRRPAVGAGALAAAGLALLVAIAAPYPRPTGEVTASIAFERVGDGRAAVDVTLTPADAADDARWFQASAWQGGGLVTADMQQVAPGHWRSESAVPIDAPWKTLLRLHRGAEMMAIPLALPADDEIAGPRGEAFPAVDKTAAFEKESLYLLREQTGGSAAYAVAVPGYVLAAGGLVIALFVWVARGVTAQKPRRTKELAGVT